MGGGVVGRLLSVTFTSPNCSLQNRKYFNSVVKISALTFIPQFESRSKEAGGIPPECARPGLPGYRLGGQLGSVADSIAVAEMSELPVYCCDIKLLMV